MDNVIESNIPFEGEETSSTAPTKAQEKEQIRQVEEIIQKASASVGVSQKKTKKGKLLDKLFELMKEDDPSLDKAQFADSTKKLTIYEIEARIESRSKDALIDKVVEIEACHDPSVDQTKLKEELQSLPEEEVKQKLASVTSDAIINRGVSEEAGVRTLLLLNLMVARMAEAASVPIVEKYDIPIDIRGWAFHLQQKKREELLEVLRDVFRKYYHTVAPFMDPLVMLIAINLSSLHEVIMENSEKKRAAGLLKESKHTS